MSRAALHHSVEDTAGQYRTHSPARGSLAAVFRGIQNIDSTQFQPGESLPHRFRGGGRVLRPHTTPRGRPAGSKCRIVVTGLKKTKECVVVCVPKNQDKI
jgi:hypothetical protein